MNDIRSKQEDKKPGKLINMVDEAQKRYNDSNHAKVICWNNQFEGPDEAIRLALLNLINTYGERTVMHSIDMMIAEKKVG